MPVAALTPWMLAVLLVAAEDPFQAHVRPTDPLTPDAQRRTFHVPPGFEVQLVAAEPEIQKPMNLAFDSRGRLWVSGSIEYPYAAKEAPGRDAIRILEDTNGDGRADKVTTFVDGLNIPMGLYPYRDGVVAYSIPNIWFFRDTDGDGRADRREVLYGPLGEPRDTHGMQNAFRRGPDGWLYICHGFANDTVIRGRDGSQVQLQSGNTYRVKLDGSRVEQFTWGQVNPFGSTWTPEGDLITADCHSHPLTLLIRNGYYESFGKPHDGLGFVPPIMTHSHGSTAIAGAAYLHGPHFGPDFTGELVVGNVMTSRVNRDTLEYRGSTIVARERDDFVSTDDPWFRPVDLQIAPDGSLYLADFYNRIIGHYEVPLTHPGRDRERGRIWRIVRTGVASAKRDLRAASLEELLTALTDPVLTSRNLAMDELSDRIGPAAIEPLRAALRGSMDAHLWVHGCWTLYRLGGLSTEELSLAARHAEPLVRIHAQRMLAETADWTAADRQIALAGLADTSPVVRRAAADALAQHPDHGQLDALLGALRQTPAEDVHLKYALRLALRNQLRSDATLRQFLDAAFTAPERALFAELALSIKSEPAAILVSRHVLQVELNPAEAKPYYAHLAAYLPPSQIGEVCQQVRQKYRADLDWQIEILSTILQSAVRRGGPLPDELSAWARSLSAELLASIADSAGMWRNEGPDNPWGTERRHSTDGQRDGLFLSSLPGGEQRVATLRSREFELPERLSFYLCGHLGFPDKPAIEANYVQLRRHDGQVLAKALPPRNDTAQRVEWDLKPHAGQRGYFEIVDGLSLNAYAWLAVARFEPPVVEVGVAGPAQVAARQIAAMNLVQAFRIADGVEPARQLARSAEADWLARAAAIRALDAFSPDVAAQALAELIPAAELAPTLRAQICQVLAATDREPRSKLLEDALRAAPGKLQRQVAQKLSESAEGTGRLLELMEKGLASARLLQEDAFRRKVAATKLAGAEARIEKLIAGLPPLNVELQILIEERRKLLASAHPNLARGAELFTKHCAACHQVQGKGAVIGPQLDGIGNRGVERIVEDILDPARNVDVAFQTTVLALADGRVLTGLLRREEGNSLILANAEGKEFAVAKGDIEEQSKSRASIMPANVAETVPLEDFVDLLGFLSSLRK